MLINVKIIVTEQVIILIKIKILDTHTNVYVNRCVKTILNMKVKNNKYLI